MILTVGMIHWKNNGPSLKLEFSRISSSRNGALTLVIDEKNGETCTVAWCASKRQMLEDAVADLRCRERTPIGNIGYLDLVDGKSKCRDEIAGQAIKKWAAEDMENKIKFVVWTDLNSNFFEKTDNAFTVPDAVSYLQGLSPKGKSQAAEYVWRSPEFVRTHLRSALQVQPWFSIP